MRIAAAYKPPMAMRRPSKKNLVKTAKTHRVAKSPWVIEHKLAMGEPSAHHIIPYQLLKRFLDRVHDHKDQELLASLSDTFKTCFFKNRYPKEYFWAPGLLFMGPSPAMREGDPGPQFDDLGPFLPGLHPLRLHITALNMLQSQMEHYLAHGQTQRSSLLKQLEVIKHHFHVHDPKLCQELSQSLEWQEVGYSGKRFLIRP